MRRVYIYLLNSVVTQILLNNIVCYTYKSTVSSIYISKLRGQLTG